MPEEPSGETKGIGGTKIKWSYVLIAGGVAVVALLVLRGGSGSAGVSTVQGTQGEPGMAGGIGPTGLTGPAGAQGLQGEPGAAANVDQINKMLSQLSAEFDQLSAFEKQFGAGIHVVLAGDTWESLAAQYKVTVAALKALNPHIAKPRVGQAILVPLQTA